MNFEPVIVGFFCNWCSYRAADLAGTMRLHHAPNLRIIRVMCSGRVESQFVLKAFKEGADGVLITGCHPGQCHYSTGNLNALSRFHLLRKMTSQFGVREERLQLVWASAAEGRELVDAINNMVRELKALGPLASKVEA